MNDHRLAAIKKEIEEMLANEWCASRANVVHFVKIAKEFVVEVERLQQWVNDLQAGMYVNCVYCGHRYGPEDEVPSSMADVLKEHIEQCPSHPMSQLKLELEAAKKTI